MCIREPAEGLPLSVPPHASECRCRPPEWGFLQVLADILYRLQVYRVFRVYRLIRVWGGAIPAPGSFGTIFSCYYFTTVYCPILTI